jgi:hypothetical protein
LLVNGYASNSSFIGNNWNVPTAARNSPNRALHSNSLYGMIEVTMERYLGFHSRPKQLNPELTTEQLKTVATIQYGPGL